MKRVAKIACAYMLLGCLGKIQAQENLSFFHQGKEVIQEARSKQPKADINAIPGYKDPSMLPQTSINENNIDQRTQEASTNNEEATFLVENSKVRPRLDIDPTTDPMFTHADEALANSEKILNVDAQEHVSEPIITRHQCTKGYDLIQKKCRWTKVPKKVGMRKEYKSYIINLLRNSFYEHYCERSYATGDGAFEFFMMAWDKGIYYLYDINPSYVYLEKEFVPGSEELNPSPVIFENLMSHSFIMDLAIRTFRNVYNGKDAVSGETLYIDPTKIVWLQRIKSHGSIKLINTRGTLDKYYAPEYLQYKVTVREEVPDIEFEDTNNCGDLESITDQGNCEYTAKHCVEGPSTKIINGVPVFADCWVEEAIYQCRTKEEDKCKSLLQKGCYQINSQCAAYLEEGHCIRWQQTYECQEGTKKLSQVSLKGDKPFCLDGSCFDQTWQPNGDMANALSKLAIFKEMQKDMNAKEHVVFKGENLGCSRVIGDFKDCCKLSGWGKNIKLASCNEDEQKLQLQRKLNKCHLIGTYCADRVLGVCTRKKTTYCCYNSKLSKLVNVQGKQQLGLSFGSAEHPDCEGLTLDQLTKIDFSKLDLSELFTEIFATLKTPNITAINKDIQKSLANKTYMINDKKNKITQGRQHGNF